MTDAKLFDTCVEAAEIVDNTGGIDPNHLEIMGITEKQFFKAKLMGEQ